MKKTILVLTILLSLITITSCNNNEEEDNNKDLVTKVNYLDDILTAYKYHTNCNSFKVTGTGVIKSSLVTQELKVIKEKNNNELYYYNASYGEALRFKISSYVEATGTNDNLTLTKGDTKENLEKNNEKSNVVISHNEFSTLYGVGINDLNYILNEDTVISITKEEDLYVLKVDLDKSTINYRTHINQTNPYETKDEETIFSYIKLEILLDENNRFKEIRYYEKYTVKTKVLLWVTQDLTAEIIEYYSYESDK